MGLNSSTSQWKSCSTLIEAHTEQQFKNKVVFIEHRNIAKQELGIDTVQIFRQRQRPYQYIMMATRIYPQESPVLTQYYESLSKLSDSIIHKNIAPLHFVKIHKENNMCLRSVKIDHYSTFYGLQLRDIIENRKKQDWRFNQDQILYTAKSLISLGSYLQQFSICFGLFQSKNIFLSSQGFLKTYLFHLQPQNKHLNYFSLLTTKTSSLSTKLPFAPEMISHLNENNLTPNFDYYKSQIFCIGMILVQMLMGNGLQRYYRIGKNQIFFDSQKLSKDLKDIKDKYSPQVLKLVQNIVNIDPEMRWNFNQADEYLRLLKKSFNFACRLKVYEQQDVNYPEQKMSYRQADQPETQYILRSIQYNLQNKLSALPLKSVSKMPQTIQRQSQSSIHRTIYTRKNTGVSIVSGNKDHKNIISAKNTSKNSRVKERQSNYKNSVNSSILDFDKAYCADKPQSQANWLTLGSTRITDENSRNMVFAPSKSKGKSVKSRFKLEIHVNKHITKSPNPVASHSNKLSADRPLTKPPIRLKTRNLEKSVYQQEKSYVPLKQQHNPMKIVRSKGKFYSHNIR